tara:strand:- start:396 stop:686 length:291 start_codon:yes stop_codon:yes gene_type:complete
MPIGFLDKKLISKTKNKEPVRHRGYIKCTICDKVFYCDKVNKKTKGKNCKCGNVWVGIHRVTDSITKHDFYIAVKYKDERPEFGDKKIKPRKKKEA